MPVRLLFDRRESGRCTSRVVIPDFKVNASLPAYRTTAVEFVPAEVGEYRFACGMNMVSGMIRVDESPPDHARSGSPRSRCPVHKQPPVKRRLRQRM